MARRGGHQANTVPRQPDPTVLNMVLLMVLHMVLLMVHLTALLMAPLTGHLVPMVPL